MQFRGAGYNGNFGGSDFLQGGAGKNTRSNHGDFFAAASTAGRGAAGRGLHVGSVRARSAAIFTSTSVREPARLQLFFREIGLVLVFVCW